MEDKIEFKVGDEVEMWDEIEQIKIMEGRTYRVTEVTSYNITCSGNFKFYKNGWFSSKKRVKLRHVNVMESYIGVKV